MILLIAVLAFLSAAYLLFWLSKRHYSDSSVTQIISLAPPVNARPLFEPTDAEVRREEAKVQAKSIAEREYHSNTRSRATVDAALRGWREFRDSKHAAELLHTAAESGLEGDFSRAAREILDFFQKSRIDGLTNNDMAALLGSHMRLISNSERASGANFWIKQEIAKLRTENDLHQ